MTKIIREAEQIFKEINRVKDYNSTELLPLLTKTQYIIDRLEVKNLDEVLSRSYADIKRYVRSMDLKAEPLENPGLQIRLNNLVNNLIIYLRRQQ